jgi:deferrochelatase/peroxidase EfeB
MADFVFNDLGSSELGEAELRNLQCNILRSTGRPASTQIFWRFKNAEELAAWLLERRPTSAATLRSDPPAEAVTILITAEGLRLLGYGEASLAKMDAAFERGAKSPETLTRLKDEVSPKWGPHQSSWHVVELRAHAQGHVVKAPNNGDYVMEHGTGIGKDGKPLDRAGHSFGHFGVLDGISKLVYTPDDYDALESKPPPGQPWKFDPRQKLSTLLVRDPLAKSGTAFGSYFVFRKYEQDREAFEKTIDSIIEQLVKRAKGHTPKGVLFPATRYPRLTQRFATVVGAQVDDSEAGIRKAQQDSELRAEVTRIIFGRNAEGTTASGNSGNDFNYGDPADAICPFHAHISKMNPRGRTGHPEQERIRALARRGTSYTKTTVAGKTTDATGLLFWSAQSSIGNQFEYIMQKWANSSNSGAGNFPTPDVDTVIGNIDRAADETKTWRNWKQTTDVDFGIWDAVKLVGAEYFYAPSLEGYQELQKRAAAIAAGAVS